MNGKFVGEDEAGNRYFKSKKAIAVGCFITGLLSLRAFQLVGMDGCIIAPTFRP